MLSSLGINPDQIYGDVYNAWLRDTHEKNSPDSKSFFRDMIEAGFLDRKIILRRQRLGVNVINSLATALHRSPLTKLDLNGNALRDTGVEVLAHLMRDLPQLTYLNLGANDIGSQGIQSLSFVIAQHRKLTTFILGSARSDPYANHITPVSATILLEGCLRNRSIRHLDLSGSAFGIEMNTLFNDTTDDAPSNSAGGKTGGEGRNSGRREHPGSTGPSHRTVSPNRVGGGGGNVQERSTSAQGTAAGGTSTLARGDAPRRPMDLLEQLIRSSSTLTTLRIKEIDLSPRGALALVNALRENATLLLLDLSHNHLPPSVADAFGSLLLDRVQLKNKCVLRTLLLNGNKLFPPTDISRWEEQRNFHRVSQMLTTQRTHSFTEEDEHNGKEAPTGALRENTSGPSDALTGARTSRRSSLLHGAEPSSEATQQHAKEQKKTFSTQRKPSSNVLINGSKDDVPTTTTTKSLAGTAGGEDGEVEDKMGEEEDEMEAEGQSGKPRREERSGSFSTIAKLVEKKRKDSTTRMDGDGEYVAFSATPQERPSAIAPLPLISSSPLLFWTITNDRFLTTLALAHCGVDDGAIYTLCRAIYSNLKLQYLSLDDNNISADGAVMLGRALCHHPCLQHLRLSSNCIEDEGGCAMASMLLGNDSLTVLDLRCTWLGDRGLIALGHALHANHSVRSIYLGDNHFTEHGGASFAAFLEKNDTVTKCELNATSVPHHTIIRLEQCLKRNAKRLANAESDALKKELVRFHFLKYKLEESRNELENLREKNADVKRHAENIDLQAKQDLGDFVKRIRELEEQVENYTKQEEKYRQLRQKLDVELEKEKNVFVEDMEVARERLQVEVKVREKGEEEFKQVEAELMYWRNNGPEREMEKISTLRQIREDLEQWSNQRKSYQQRALQLSTELSELSAQLKKEGKSMKVKRIKKEKKVSKKKATT